MLELKIGSGGLDDILARVITKSVVLEVGDWAEAGTGWDWLGLALLK